MLKRLVIGAILSCSINFSFAQGYVDQNAVASLSESQTGDIDNVQKVQWQVYDYKYHHKKGYTGAWSELLAYIDSLPGEMQEKRRYVVELANRVTGDNLKQGRKLVIPTSFPEDYRAYSPYPFHYAAAADLPKLFIVDKFTQTFGAYEYGKLVRWGLVSSGRENGLTPSGRYNFNWKDEHRFSNAAPPGEEWEMFWVVDFHADWGIHVHQYSLPIASAASHGCVRVAEADAKWNYNWANTWIQSGNKLKRNGTPVIVINNNPSGRPAHWLIEGYSAVSQVHLPDNLMEIPAGTYAQKVASWKSGW
jgi:hypothetical protein